MPAFAATCREFFPRASTDDDYVAQTVEVGARYGFDRENAIACVGLCRDELSRELRDLIQKAWGEAFNFSGLGGMLFVGRTGFMAAHAHAPIVNGRERYVYFAMPHIAIDADGVIGACARTGRPRPSAACGALMAFLDELKGSRVRLTSDPLDLEQTLLQQRLMEVVPHDHTPTLVEVTHAARRIIAHDLARMIKLTLDPSHADCLAFSGIQIHGPDGGYVEPAASWAVIEGQRIEIGPDEFSTAARLNRGANG